MALKARSGVVDELARVDIPVEMPDNTDVELAEMADDGLDEDDPLLEAAIDRSMEQIARGETIPVEEVLERLRLRSLDEALSGKADTRG
jgi:predicted transcriptional regulator